jgi:hypothetical protein
MITFAGFIHYLTKYVDAIVELNVEFVKKSNICGSKNIFKKYKNPTGCI